MTSPREIGAGDTRWQAVTDLFKGHEAWLRRTIRAKFGQRVSPEDIVQETYLRVLNVGAVSYPRSFLLRVASRLAVDVLRRETAAQGLTEPAQVNKAYVAPEQPEALLLSQVLAGLPATCREAFLLSRFGGLAYEEIASRLGVSVKTIEWRISKALAYCADRLDL